MGSLIRTASRAGGCGGCGGGFEGWAVAAGRRSVRCFEFAGPRGVLRRSCAARASIACPEPVECREPRSGLHESPCSRQKRSLRATPSCPERGPSEPRTADRPAALPRASDLRARLHQHGLGRSQSGPRRAEHRQPVAAASQDGADRHLFLRSALERGGERPELGFALDVQRDRFGAQDHPTGQRQPRLVLADRLDRRDELSGAGIHSLGEPLRARQPRCDMASSPTPSTTTSGGSGRQAIRALAETSS